MDGQKMSAAQEVLQSAARILVARGHGNSANNRLAVDGEGNPLPWMTYPAIDYVNGLDLREKRVFEYGAGTSTVYWAQRCRSLTSVEHSMQWHEGVALSLQNSGLTNYSLLLREREREYLEAVHLENLSYDLIAIDGGFNRRKMAEHALTRLAPGGCIILDNSDCHVKAAETLRTSKLDLIQIDFIGFAPGNQLEQATSFYLTRDFRWKPREHWQPQKTPGCMQHCAVE